MKVCFVTIEIPFIQQLKVGIKIKSEGEIGHGQKRAINIKAKILNSDPIKAQPDIAVILPANKY